MTDHAQLVRRLRNWNLVGDQVDLRRLAADAIEALVKERDEANANAHLFLDRPIIGDKAMGEGDAVATFFAMKARAAAAEAEVVRLNAALAFAANEAVTAQEDRDALIAAEAEVVKLRKALSVLWNAGIAEPQTESETKP